MAANDNSWNLKTHQDYVQQRTSAHKEWHWASNIWQMGDNSVMFFQENPALACCRYGIRNDFSGKPSCLQPPRQPGFFEAILKQIAEKDPQDLHEEFRRTPSPLSSNSSGYGGSRLSSESSNRWTPTPPSTPTPTLMDEAVPISSTPILPPIQGPQSRKTYGSGRFKRPPIIQKLQN